MKRIGAVVFYVMVIGYSYGQITNIQGLDNVVIRTKKYEDIKGSAYLYPSWAAGTLTDRNGKVYNDLLIKYDSYKDQVELNQEGKIFEVAASMYPKFTLNYVEPTTNNVIKHLFSAAYNIEGFPKTSYFDLLLEGNLILLRKFKTSFIEENVSGYGTSGAQKSFQSKTLYFVVDKDGISKEIKASKKSIFEVFPEQTPSLETFMKEKKIKGKTEADLIEIIKFLNSR